MLSKIPETLFWGEDYILEMAPGQHTKPLALAFDGDAEELSFPTIYYFQPREFKVPVINSFNLMFRNVRDSTCPITRERLDDPEFLRETMNRNESFLSCLPNSIQYWQRRKNDLFAMMRQLGKQTVFLTLSASEIYWAPLMKCVYRFKHHIPEDESIDDIILEEMTGSQRAELVNGDLVLCCLYFDRLVGCIVNAIKLKKGPFGKYKLIEYFRRVEFQHRGSPHCHMLLWLENAPPDDERRFVNGEHVPKTIELIDELCTADSSQIGSERKLQTHRHTHACFKRNTRTCLFGAPFWPMKSTRILLPVTEADRIEALSDLYKSLREVLEQSESDDEMAFNTIEQFGATNSIESEDEYLKIHRHGIHRPTVMYRRSMRDLMTSPFNPTILSVLQSNMTFNISWMNIHVRLT
ncbi:unnamed protein product [Chilo suppressalis]|uniref:Helitron helicase-like domain-containing protein n=1 Tax=Chilo suppressalis TaxID=168631 RepID=A0ABN8AZQ9_CHISP|nr:unnamed protein product [Chilo suppressalis]